jgi:hypothetical protein
MTPTLQNKALYHQQRCNGAKPLVPSLTLHRLSRAAKQVHLHVYSAMQCPRAAQIVN